MFFRRECWEGLRAASRGDLDAVRPRFEGRHQEPPCRQRCRILRAWTGERQQGPAVNRPDTTARCDSPHSRTHSFWGRFGSCSRTTELQQLKLCSPELHSAPLLSVVLLGLAHSHFLLMFSLLVSLHLFLPPAQPPPTTPNPLGQSTFSMVLDTPSPIASWWDFAPFLCSFLWLLLVQVLPHRCTL